MERSKKTAEEKGKEAKKGEVFHKRAPKRIGIFEWPVCKVKDPKKAVVGGRGVTQGKKRVDGKGGEGKRSREERTGLRKAFLRARAKAGPETLDQGGTIWGEGHHGGVGDRNSGRNSKLILLTRETENVTTWGTEIQLGT